MNNYWNKRGWKSFLTENKKYNEGCGDPTVSMDAPPMDDRGPVHVGLEPDHEGEMARSQLMGAQESSMALLDMIQDGDQLPAWLQSKLTKAADYLDMARRYMQYKGSAVPSAVSMQENAGDLSQYSPLAVEAAKAVLQKFPRASERDGAMIENEVYYYLEELPEVKAMAPEQVFALGDEALSAAGVMMGVGPDVL
jgi:hypothetical protein